MRGPSIDLDRHQRFRAILRRHQNAAAATIPVPLMPKCGRDFGLLKGKQLQLETDAELIILMDHALYDRRDRGKTTVQRYLEKLPQTDDSDEALVRAAMAAHRYSLYEVATVHPGVGLVHRDLVRGGTVFVVDVAMSQTIAAGALMAERLLPLPDYWAPSGAGFPISPEAAWEIQQTLVPALEASEDDLTAMSPEAAADLATAILRAGFEEGTTGEVTYL
jgi:hypothetical protein